MTFLGLGLVELIMLGLWIFAMIDVLVTPAAEVRNLQKALWFLIVLLILPGLWIIGTALWFIFGRPRASVPAGQSAPQRGRTGGRSATNGPRRSMAPDDDIDFLRGLNRKPGDPS
jgi:amino acid transporter